MASWGDYISLFFTLSLIGGVVYAVLFLNQQIRKAAGWSKEKLQKKGVEVSEHGVSVKSKTKLADREEYMDATQRGFIKALHASSGGHSASSSPNLSGPSQTPSRLSRPSAESSHISSKSSSGHSSRHGLHRKTGA